MAVIIQGASVQDRNGAVSVVEKLTESLKRIIKIFANGGYAGKLIAVIKEKYKIELEISTDEIQKTMKGLIKPVWQWCIYPLCELC